MPLDPMLCGLQWLRCAVLATSLAPSALFAQVAEEPPTTVQVTLLGYTFAPELTDTGAPVLDDDGEPVILRVPLEESVITPGDQVLYVIELSNPTEEPTMNLQLGAQVAEELVLDPFSITGPEALVTEWSDEEDPTHFRHVFIEVDGETVMQADLVALRILRLTLPELPPSAQTSIEYTVTLR